MGWGFTSGEGLDGWVLCRNDEEIEEIWKAVGDGTAIEIRP
jgi:hypothetical protein